MPDPEPTSDPAVNAELAELLKPDPTVWEDDDYTDRRDDYLRQRFETPTPRHPMISATEIADLMATLTPDQIDQAADELKAYAAARRQFATTREIGKFNYGGFFANLIKVLEAVVTLLPKAPAPVPPKS